VGNKPTIEQAQIVLDIQNGDSISHGDEKKKIKKVSCRTGTGGEFPQTQDSRSAEQFA
jgi:hypothetical protein